MAVCVTSSSSIFHMFIMICTSAKYFAYSTTTWQEDVWVCIQQMKNDRNGPEIQTDSKCVSENSLHFMFHFYDDIIEYRLKRADTELKDSDFPVFYLKERKLHPISIDNISQESGLVSQELYKSEDSTIVLECYSTADAQHKYQLSGVLQQNDTFWAILPFPKQNGSYEKNGFFLDEDMCYQHRILELSSGHFSSLSQRNQIRTKRSVFSTEYIIDLAFLIDSTVFDLFLENIPSSWEVSFPKVRFILKEYYSFLLVTINEFFKVSRIRIKCPVLIVYSSKNQPMDWARPKGNDSVTNPLTALKEIGNWLKNVPENFLHTADHIMLVTRHPIDDLTHFLNGYTLNAGLCTEQRLSIIQEEFDGSVALAATQLIAYNIGINFDGFKNECAPKKYFIMSSDLDPNNLAEDNLNLFQFSDCSIKQLAYHLKNGLIGKCLKNSSNVAALDSFQVMRPGQRYVANEQCFIHFGNTSDIYQCEKENFRNRYNFCIKMLCPYKGMCKSILALEGTSCGTKMWCYNGRCRSHTEAPDINRGCWLGNRKMSVKIENKTYLCKDISYEKGKRCYNDEIRKQCCWSCSYFYTGVPGCEYGDRTDQCWSRECFFYRKKRATHDCCRTCSVMPKSSSAVRCFNIWHTLCFLSQFIFHIMRQYFLFEK